MKNINFSLFFIVFSLFACSSAKEELKEIEEEFTFNAISEPLIAGTVSLSNGIYKKGTKITLTAIPNQYYAFKNWTNPINSNANPVEIIVTSNIDIKALFEKNDLDEDGILNNADICPKTTKGDVVDNTGCSVEQNKDDDGDGVINGMDLCANTPKSTPINSKGCTTITDIEGNIYGTVTIGTQIWMTENLKTQTYNDGTSITKIQNTEKWRNLSSGALSDYQNNLDLGNEYGKLYNFFAATKAICPENWHVPTKEEWDTLNEFLGVEKAGAKLKQIGYTHWFSPNTGATDEFGFSAIGGGARYAAAGLDFDGIDRGGFYWSSTPSSQNDIAFASILGHSRENIIIQDFKKINGASVRCIKN